MNINEKIQLDFTIDELNELKKCLMELPFKLVINVIGNIDKQVNDQIKGKTNE